MSKLDLSPFHTNSSKVFHFDRFHDQIDIYKQAIFQNATYTTTIKDISTMNITSNRQVEKGFSLKNRFLIDGYLDGHLR